MGQLMGIGWQNVLDIALNTYILFRLYVLFRGTNVLRVLFAMAVLGVLRQVAVSMGLIITTWVLQGVIAVAALVIIIVFRNEISSVLQTKDLKSFFWGIPRYQLKTPMGIIVESVYEMARKKTGALIVLPLNKGLESVVQGGISWQGKLSKEMLLSIFWGDNPVHDGAAVIQGDRITNVGVILPLSKRTDIPSHFGTRHRAALGLAEQTDALVIVVSEERGKITLVRNNQIYDINDASVLEKLLVRHAGGETPAGGFQKQTRELALAAAICLVCVTGLWLSFSRGMETLATHLAVSRNTITLPPGISIKNIEPSQLEVLVDVPVQKELAIQPVWVGKLARDLIMTQVSAVPQKVNVIGPTQVLMQMHTLFTEPLSLENIQSSDTLTADIDLRPASIRLADQKKIKVQVSYTVEKREKESQ
ncbi:MAG: diadenylate cyclase [Desulfobacteraceae bacterium]|nr:diadenylate cyclase [Desulfobacteraceae bacterium]